MKKVLSIAFLLALAATPAMSLSILNTSHDMIASGHATATDGASAEICIFCHTPHNAQTAVGTVMPLWNNTAAGSVDATMYGANVLAGSDIDFAPTVAGINATDALICLACHDAGVGDPVNGPNLGTIAAELVTTMSVQALMSTDMSNDHPIGMDLAANPQLTDPGIHPIATIRTNFGNVDPFFGGDPNDGINIMWCSSCHNVHDNTNAPFLRKDNTGSALCKACHKK